MKTDAMDAAVAEAVGDGSAAGNIVVGSQLQIVGTVSTRSMTDRGSSHSVLLECRHLSRRGRSGPRQAGLPGLIPGGQQCRGLATGELRGDDGDDDDDVTRNDPQRPPTL